jgi:hypothetical protein
MSPKESYSMRWAFSVMVAIVLAVTPTIGQPQKPIGLTAPQSGLVCITRMKDAFEPSRSTLRRLTITTTDDFGEKVQFAAGQAYKNFPDGKKMVLTMLEPKAVRGLTYLFWDRKDQPNKWVYIPTIRRVLEITPLLGYQPFLGSEFTVSDIGFISVPEACELVEVTNLAGVKAYEVEEKVLDGVYYSRIITWIATDSFLPIQRDYYDKEGKLWMTDLFKEVTTIDKVAIPLLIERKDVQRGYSTTIRVTNLTTDVNVPDKFFDFPDEFFRPKQLSNAVNSPLWKKITSNASEVK